MTLQETRRLLTIIWSLYPNAPKLTKEDKDLMVMSWLALFYEYNIKDVWKAARACFEHEPRFVPSAPEVLKRCERTLDEMRFAPVGYDKIAEGVDTGFNASCCRRNIISCYERTAPEDRDKEFTALYEKAKDDERRIEKLRQTHHEMFLSAWQAYEDAERAKLIEEGTAEGIRLLESKD